MEIHRYQHIFEHETQKYATSDLFTQAFLKEKNLNVLLRPFYSVLLFFVRYSKHFIIMRTKNLYGINNNSNGVGVMRMYVMTCVTMQ